MMRAQIYVDLDDQGCVARVIPGERCTWVQLDKLDADRWPVVMGGRVTGMTRAAVRSFVAVVAPRFPGQTPGQPAADSENPL